MMNDSRVLLLIWERVRSSVVGVVVRLLESHLRVECWWQSCRGGAASVFVTFKGKPAACSGPNVGGRVGEKEKNFDWRTYPQLREAGPCDLN